MPDASYEGMLTEIERLEAVAKREALCLVDISGVMAGGQEGATAGYGTMLSIVEGVESRPQRGAAKQQAARQAQEKEPRRTAGNVGAGQPMREEIKEKMKGIVSGLPEAKTKFGEMRIKRINTKDLVLPNLPISDQIQELEQIVAALNENALNKDQKKVARLEVEGLQQYVQELEEELARENKALSAIDRSLWDMRAQRLNEALALFKKGV